MRKIIWSFAALLLVVTNLKAQSPKTIHCFSGVQALVTSSGSPTPPVGLLDVEIPEGGKFVNATFFARPRIGGQVLPWSKCPPSGPCQGVYFPPLSSGGVAPDEKTVHFGSMITGGVSSPPGFSGETWVRLIVEYTTTESVCKSQNSFQVVAGWGTAGFGLIILPRGKTPSILHTFGAELVPTGKWLDCGSTTNPPSQPQTCMVANGNIGGLSFTLSPFTDESDQVYIVQNLCHNWASNRRGCRTVVEYSPEGARLPERTKPSGCLPSSACLQ